MKRLMNEVPSKIDPIRLRTILKTVHISASTRHTRIMMIRTPSVGRVSAIHSVERFMGLIISSQASSVSVLQVIFSPVQVSRI